MQIGRVLRRTISTLMILGAILGATEVWGQAAAAPAAPAPAGLDAAEARDLFGNWTMSLTTPDGTSPVAFTIGEQNGKVAVTFGGAEGAAITDISKTDGGFVARYQIDYQGMSLPVLITVARDGQNLKTNWDFGGGAYVTSGTATKN